MLSLDKEDELKIYKKFNLHNYENSETSNNNSNNKNFKYKDNLTYGNTNQNDGYLKSRKDIIGVDIGDEIIYTNTSTCNSFIYIITKFCFYIFDNYDFSFVNIYALKYDHINNYGCHNKVFLSPIDNTIYIISKNLNYVYAYYIVNKNDVVILDYDKNAHSFNINEHYEEDSSENENEYYEYITYIKNSYRKKKKVYKNVSIKLITMLYLPISSSCLVITKTNILFFSHETDEIFISDNVQNILASNSLTKREHKVNKVVFNTKIVSLKYIKYKRKEKNNCSHNNKKRKEINFFFKEIRNKYKKFGEKNSHTYYSLKKGEVRGFIRNNSTYRNYIKYCNKIKNNITKRFKKKKKKNFHPFYLYSVNKENNLYDFIKNKISDAEKEKEYKNSIAIKGISKVEFSAHNDYLLLLSNSNNLYIFSFFHNFFNFSKEKCCYYSGKSVHKNNYRKCNEQSRQGNELPFQKEKKNKLTKVRTKKKDVIGLYVGSSIIDISINIFRKIILIINDDLTIKAYSTHPYICKHTFRGSLFTINIFNSSIDTIYYYNFLIWNKQHNFFLLSFNENNYYIFNINGTLYYSMKNDLCANEEKNESDNELKKFQTEYSMHFNMDKPDLVQDKNNASIINSGILSNNNVCVDNNTNLNQKKYHFDNNPLGKSKTVRTTNSVMNISFVFNDFKLFYVKNMDENYYYINVKKFLYLNDIYSNNKTFHYNSNYYTNQNCKKIYIGLNNIVMFDTSLNKYNVNDYEKNNVNIREVTTPFKFIKKAYLNFDNTYILIIFKSICLYNIQKKAFSYFVDDYFKYFFHNYPSGWLCEDVFFVTCLHNKYDEYNFKRFKKKNDYNDRIIKKKENVNFKVYDINYEETHESREECKDEIENEEYKEYSEIESEIESESEIVSATEGESENEDKGNNEEIKENHKNIESVNSEEKEHDLEESRILNYLFNFNHNERDTYFKFFEEYFNINKCNIYAKPFSLFYNNFFLKKEKNVFLKNFLEQRKEKVPTKCEEKESFKEIVSDEASEYINSTYYSSSIKNKISKNINLTSKIDSKKNENLKDTYLNDNINDNQSVYDFLSESSTSSNNENICENEKNEFFEKINNACDYSNNANFIKTRKYMKKENENNLNEATNNYEETLNKNNFYYVIYFYNLNNPLKFTNYICSIRLLYRPILAHVYYNTSLEKQEKNNNINEKFLIVLDAFYNLFCFKITEIKYNTNKSKTLKAENIFVLPLNRDKKFIEPSCFYSIFNIYNYVFLNYDNSIYFLHIYLNHNNCYDFQFTHIFDHKLDYIEIIKDHENVLYYSLPSPIKYIWPNPMYYMYLFYYYIIYILYKINKANKKSSISNFLFPFFSNKRNKKMVKELMDKIQILEEKEINTENMDEKKLKEQTIVTIKNNSHDVAVNELLSIENNKICLQTEVKNSNNNDNCTPSYKSCVSSTEASSFDLFCLNPFANNIKKNMYKNFENVFKDKLNKHSLNYQSLIKLKKINNKDSDYWLRSKKEAIVYINKLNSLLKFLFMCDNYEEKNEKKKKENENEEINNKNERCEKQDNLLENLFYFLFHNILRNHKKIVHRMNKIFKYNLYHIIEELENKEDTCYLYVSRNNYINVISISKCSNKFFLMKELRNKEFFQSSPYNQCDLFIYRYMKLKKFANEHKFHLHHTMHNMGLFIKIICNQITKSNIKESLKKIRDNAKNYIYSKDIAEETSNRINYSRASAYDKIIFQVNSYIDVILFRFLKLYSDMYSYRGNKYEHIFNDHSKKRKVRYLIINIILKYIRQNIFVVNILDIILYKSLYKLNDLYIVAYKFIYNYLNNLSETPYYSKYITKNKIESILNISIMVLYTFFLSKNYKKKKVEILENAIFCSISNRNNNEVDFSFEDKKLNKNLKKEIFMHLSENDSIAFSNDEFKINTLKKNTKDAHIYNMILYLLKLKDENITKNKEENSIFEIKSDYAYKINYNIYYIVLYILCILKKKYVFNLYTLLKILKKYCKYHASGVVINTIRKMDPYISAILIYSIGNLNPHDFMQLCLKNERFNISSLYIINVQNYIGMYDVRKFYCIYFLYMSLRYNIKYSKSLIQYLSILFYVLFENRKKHIFHWNYIGIEPQYVKSLKKTHTSLDNFLLFLKSAYNLNNVESREIVDINDLQFFFENSYKSEVLIKNNQKSIKNFSSIYREIPEVETHNSANNYIYNKELDKIEEENKSNWNITSFSYKKFKMNKIIYEFFYNYDIIHISNKNIDTFLHLHTCNNSIFDYFSSENKNSDEKSDDEKNFSYEEIKNIYIKFIILIQSIVCYYIYNMLWFELYYFITYLKIDILSFFSHSFLFKSNLFQNIFWGICPIDVAQYSINCSEFYFLYFNQKNKKLTQDKDLDINNNINCSANGNNSMNMNNKNNLKEFYEIDNMIKFNDMIHNKHENIRDNNFVNNVNDNKYNNNSANDNYYNNKGKKNYYLKKKNNFKKKSHNNCSNSNDYSNNSEVTNYLLHKNKEDSEKKNLIHDVNYMEYVNYMKKLKHIFDGIEKENEIINKSFLENEQKNIFLIDIYKSFKNSFHINFCKKIEKKKDDTIHMNKQNIKYLNKTEMENKKKKYKKHILSYNIYNKPTNYIFLETYFAPSVYKYIPIYNTLKYLFCFFNICNRNNNTIPKKYLKHQIKRRIYDYIHNNIIDLKKKNKNRNKYKKKKTRSINELCSIHKNDIIWFLLRIFLLLKLPLHALALILYCKNYILLNILLNVFPYLHHIFNYVLNMNNAHFSYRKKDNENIKHSNIDFEENKKYCFILINEKFNKKFCEYCYYSILHYKKKNIIPFSIQILEIIYKKKINDKSNNLYDHFMSCDCLNNLIFLKKKLFCIRKSI